MNSRGLIGGSVTYTGSAGDIASAPTPTVASMLSDHEDRIETVFKLADEILTKIDGPKNLSGGEPGPAPLTLRDKLGFQNRSLAATEDMLRRISNFL